MTQDLRIDTVNIRQLRKLLESNKELLTSIGQIAQLRVVIDANFVIRDLLRKIRYPDRGRTALEEVVRASVLEVYAPRWLETELISAIQQVSQRRKIAEVDLWSAWEDYRSLIKCDETWEMPPESFNPSDDPKDIPYINLERMLNAVGVLSSDRDIEQMGGNPLALDFVLATRDYARTVVVSMSIRVSGHMLGVIAIESLVGIANAVKRSLERLPTKWKLVVVGAAIIFVLHPRSRAWLVTQARKLGPTAKVILETALTLASHEAQKREESRAHLLAVHEASGRPIVFPDSASVSTESRPKTGGAPER